MESSTAQAPSRATSPASPLPSTTSQALSAVTLAVSQSSLALSPSASHASPITSSDPMNILRERVKLAGTGTFSGLGYDCRVSPSVIPYHVELRYDFHDIKRTIFTLWCVDTEENPAFLSIDKKDDAYDLALKMNFPGSFGVEGVFERLKQSSTRPDSVLRSMAQAIYDRDMQKQNEAVDSLRDRINQMIASTDTGRLADITLEEAKVVAKGVMDGHILISSLNHQYQTTEPAQPTELVQIKDTKKAAEPSTGEKKDEVQKLSKRAKKNAKRSAAQKAKREAEKAGGQDVAGESVKSDSASH